MSNPDPQTTETVIQQNQYDSFAVLESLMRDCHAVQVDSNVQLRLLVDMLGPILSQKDVRETEHLIANQILILNRHSHIYMAVFTPNAVSNIQTKNKGIIGSLSLPAGWSFIIEPDGTELTPPTGVDQVIATLYTNWKPF